MLLERCHCTAHTDVCTLKIQIISVSQIILKFVYDWRNVHSNKTNVSLSFEFISTEARCYEALTDDYLNFGSSNSKHNQYAPVYPIFKMRKSAKCRKNSERSSESSTEEANSDVNENLTEWKQALLSNKGCIWNNAWNRILCDIII